MIQSKKTIEIVFEDQMATIWLNRPDLHNAMNDIMIGELTQAFADIGANTAMRLIVLRGKGKSFCAGADLNYMKGIAQFGFDENVEDGMRLANLFKAIYECPIPTLALVHGAAYGGANGLVAACDIVLAADETTFAFSEVKLGIAPATIGPYVIRRIGEYGARELMITGKRFNGKEAEKWRLINHAVPEAELEDCLSKMLRIILSSGPMAVRATKNLIQTVVNEGSSSESMSDYTANLIAQLRASKEGQEGMAAFLDKRKPNWMT